MNGQRMEFVGCAGSTHAPKSWSKLFVTGGLRTFRSERGAEPPHCMGRQRMN